MKLDQTEVFVEVVRCSGFTAAAESLSIPKSTVSRHVAGLEDRLGVKLLHRTTRSLRLTDVGAVFYERAQKIIGDLRAAEQSVLELQKEPCGELRMTAPLTFAFLGPVFATYLREYPAVEVDLHCTDSVVDILGGGFDLAIRAGALADSSLVSQRLGVVRRELVASGDYLERWGRPSAPADLEGHDLLVFSGGKDGRDWTLKKGRRQIALHLRPRLEVNDYDVLLEAVRSGAGIALLPHYLCDGAGHVQSSGV